MLCGCADGNINHRVQSKQLYNYTINLLVYWYIHECMHAYMHTCMRAYMHTCINAYMHTCIHAYMHTCIHAYLHTCIHAYIGSLGGVQRTCGSQGCLGGVQRTCGSPGVSKPTATNCNGLQQTGEAKSPQSPSRALCNYTIVQLYNYTIGILVYWYIGWYIGILEYWRQHHTPDLGRRII